MHEKRILKPLLYVLVNLGQGQDLSGQAANIFFIVNQLLKQLKEQKEKHDINAHNYSNRFLNYQ